MLTLVKSIAYFIAHPFDTFHVTIVRRYADAQGHFIGELYQDERMIGASCDNWPLNADVATLPSSPRVCWRKSFLEPLPSNTLRVGAFEPSLNAIVQEYVAMRRWLPLRVTVCNRFVEHVLASMTCGNEYHQDERCCHDLHCNVCGEHPWQHYVR
jgi:hypothetical protein